MVTVHKRTGEYEEFNEKKVYNSCYKAALGAELSKGEAHGLARICAKEIKKEIIKHKHIESSEIRNLIRKTLRKRNPDVAAMYDAIKEVG